MTTDEIMSRLLPLFRDVLDNDKLVIDLKSNAETMPGYDSLAHINVITAIEQEFRISFEFLELVRLRDVGDMVALIASKRAAA